MTTVSIIKNTPQVLDRRLLLCTEDLKVYQVPRVSSVSGTAVYLYLEFVVPHTHTERPESTVDVLQLLLLQTIMPVNMRGQRSMFFLRQDL